MIESLSQAESLIRAVERDQWNDLSDILKGAIDENMGSGVNPIVRVANVAEAIYAQRDKVPDEVKLVGAELAEWCDLFGHMAWRSGRGGAAARTLRRDAGEKLPGAPRRSAAEREPISDSRYQDPPPVEEPVVAEE